MNERTVKELDVRVISPIDKHPTIFRTFDELSVDEAFILINDHDPVPLHYQFEAERNGEYAWEYEQRDPGMFRVRLTRIKEAPAGVDRRLPGCGCGEHD